jgi:hypothetical protein
MNGSFGEESDRFGREVDAEAARLVRRGMPPYEAIEKARGIVSARRAEQARREDFEAIKSRAGLMGR